MAMSDGGPAFPLTAGPDGDRDWNRSGGMSLRDYFAGQAVAVMLSDARGVGVGDEGKWIAVAAYYVADAMIAAREAQSPVAGRRNQAGDRTSDPAAADPTTDGAHD